MKYKEKGFSVLIFILFFSLFAEAQTPKKGNVSKDSVESNIPTIVIVPFNPAMYFGDTDHFISDATGIPAGEVRLAFRATLANNIHQRLETYYHTVNLLTLQDPESRELLHKVYKAEVYTEKFRSILYHHKATPTNRFWQFFSGKKRKWGVSCIDPNPPMPYKKDGTAQTALLDLRSQHVLQEMKRLYNADYVLFMNQFRVQTRYKQCMNIGHNIYQRDYLLSFTLLDMEGKKLTEGVIGTTYQSPTNNLKTILEKNISYLEDFAAGSVKDGLKTRVKNGMKEPW